MLKRIIPSCLCCLLFLGLATGCKRANPKAGHNSSDYFQTHFQDESQFIVETIVSDIAEQVYFAKFHKLPDARIFSVSVTETAGSKFGAPTYELRVDLDAKHQGLKTKLDVNGPIWSPEAYDATTAWLAKSADLAVGEPGDSGDSKLLEKLTDGEARTIEQQNQSVSGALENDFTNAGLHEQAAIILGAFMLREHSGDFFEIRSPLCRMTAHLAIARYLQAGKITSSNGRMAEVMLLTLINNQAAALEKLNGIPTNSPALISWARALAARNSSDYRPLEKLNGLSQIECIEWFYALDRAANADIAWSKLSEPQKKTVGFVRIGNQENYSVGMGHELLAVSLPLEFQEIGSVYELSQSKKLKKENLVAVLNEMPDRCVYADNKNVAHVHVIGWGLWAGFLQRQLCHAVQHDFDFLQRKWGVPDEAKTFSAKVDKSLNGLRLYPFVQRFNAIDVATYHKSVDDGFKVTVATPQLVPAQCWNYLCYNLSSGESYRPNPNPHVNEWHKHNPPPGTAYNPLPRLNHPSLIDHPEAVDRIHEIAPYDGDIAWYIWKTKYKEQPTYAQASELFQPVLAYNCYAMRKVADTVQDQPVKYEQLLAKSAESNPSDYFKLADYFELRNADKAANYIEKGNSLDPDSVRASYYASWLVKYYLNKGQVAAARREADFAGEVYSSVGLQAKAEFLEATGDYVGAFQWFSNIEERYEDSGPIIAFCMRYKNKTNDSKFDNEIKTRVAKSFPRGIEHVALADFKAAPTDGVSINEATPLARAAGLKVGDVIVAINGIRVHDFNQYCFGRNLSVAPEINLIVWQGSEYREIKASPPNHRFGGDFGDYKPHR